MNVILMIAMAMNAAAASVSEKAAEVPGQVTFTKKCTACHAKDGKGSVAMAKMFKVKPEILNLTSDDVKKTSDADLMKIIVVGKNKMPAFKGKLKDSEIGDVLAYVRSLDGKADTAPAAPPTGK